MPQAALDMSVEDVLTRVRTEFLETPQPDLTAAQIRRLLILDRALCSVLLDALIDAGFLRRTPDGRYIRAEY